MENCRLADKYIVLIIQEINHFIDVLPWLLLEECVEFLQVINKKVIHKSVNNQRVCFYLYHLRCQRLCTAPFSNV